MISVPWLARTLHTLLSLSSFPRNLCSLIQFKREKERSLMFLNIRLLSTHFFPVALWEWFAMRGPCLRGPWEAPESFYFLCEQKKWACKSKWNLDLKKSWSWILNVESAFSEWVPNLEVSPPSSDSVCLPHWTALSNRDMQTLPWMASLQGMQEVHTQTQNSLKAVAQGVDTLRTES